MVDFSILAIGKHLKLLTNGMMEGQHETIFEGDYTKKTRLWKIDKVVEH